MCTQYVLYHENVPLRTYKGIFKTSSVLFQLTACDDQVESERDTESKNWPS